jgi:putative transposase
MARRQRYDHPGAIHHVMNRGVNRQAVFFDDDDRIEFGRRLAEAYEMQGITTLAYCLMDNHYHLLLRSNDGKLSEAMQRLGSLYTLRTNRRVGRDGPLFRGRFHSISVTNESYLLTALRYIHRNALDLPDVRSIEQYRWSSVRAYFGLRTAPQFLDVEVVRDLFGGDISRIAEFHGSADWGDAFADRTESANSETLFRLVQLAAAEDDLRFGLDDRLPQRLERSVAVLLAHSDMPAEIAEAARTIANFPSEVGRRMALLRARRRLESDQTLQRVMAVLTRRLTSRDILAA